MKKVFATLALPVMFLSGCASQAPAPTPVAPAPQTQAPAATPADTSSDSKTSNVYPDESAKVGEKYGEMVVARNPSAKMSSFVDFKGNVTVTGDYTYYGKDEPFSINDQVCFLVTNPSDLKKLPQSQYFLNVTGGKKFCFTNNDVANKLFGTGKGTATIVISALTDNMSFEGEALSEATLVSVASKTVDKK